jgi:ankyrin repeat protein
LLRADPKVELVILMLEHGADCKIIDKWGFNAMHWFAMCCSEVDVLKALLKAHGDINIPDASGETPLHTLMYNVQGLSLDILHAFLESGADVNKDDKDSQSRLSEYFISEMH